MSRKLGSGRHSAFVLFLITQLFCVPLVSAQDGSQSATKKAAAPVIATGALAGSAVRTDILHTRFQNQRAGLYEKIKAQIERDANPYMAPQRSPEKALLEWLEYGNRPSNTYKDPAYKWTAKSEIVDAYREMDHTRNLGYKSITRSTLLGLWAAADVAGGVIYALTTGEYRSPTGELVSKVTSFFGGSHPMVYAGSQQKSVESSSPGCPSGSEGAISVSTLK